MLLDIFVTRRAAGLVRSEDGDDIGLANLCTIVLCNENWMTSSSGNEKEEKDKAHILCLL